MEVSFYHLTKSPIEHALPRLLERALEGGYKILLLTENLEQAQAFDALLWTYAQSSFLPHGLADQSYAHLQPILLSAEEVTVNHPTLAAVIDGRTVQKSYERVLDIFNGLNPESVAAARNRWSTYKEAGHTLTYWAQDEEGKWIKRNT